MVLSTALDRILPTVTKPARYTGGEWNHARKDWSQAWVRIALAYPDVYEVGMSNLGLAILYELLNALDQVLAERVYAPWPDMEDALRRAGIPLYSLESRHPLGEFDMIGFTLQYELNYSNVVTMLDLAGIPLLASSRLCMPETPLVIAGGTCTFNPEPLADLIDLFVIGDGEEVAVELAQLCLQVRKRADGTQDWRGAFLEAASQVEGVYVPNLYEASYARDGTVLELVPRQAGIPRVIRKRIVRQLPPPPLHPVVPFVQTVHDRAMIEVMRGCRRGCRFCEAGITYRPVRERPMEEVLRAADSLLANTGHEEIALVSLSSTDHTAIEPLVRELTARYAGKRISVSLPSLRIDAFSVELAEMLQRTRKTGLTFAPEAGSERLRRVINKGVTTQDLLHTVEAAYSSGWQRVKLYFMIGLPTETISDVLAISELVRAVRDVGRRARGKRVRVNLSVNTFVPKPHTPFQWLPMTGTEQIRLRQQALRRELQSRAVKLSWSDQGQTWLEAVFARGDRRLGRVIVRAWELGARFDAWNECFRVQAWRQAFVDSSLDPDFYTMRERSREECLPWDHIDTGVTKAFLWEEFQRALREEPSDPCGDSCLTCGIRVAYGLDRCPATAEQGC